MANPLYRQHFISINDLSTAQLEFLLALALQLKQQPQADLLDGRLIGSCFFEPSTRTRLSFETAIQRLGGKVIGFADGANTSAKKGETLADTARIISNYADAIVMRHPKDGAARVVSEFARVPVINAGDGTNQHPSQTLLDLVTIYETQGHLQNLKIALVGDLKYGRIQRERFDEQEFARISGHFNLCAAMLGQAKPNMRILHPLPRVDEIHADVDDSIHAYYFQQANNGMYARQAILAAILNEHIDIVGAKG